MEPTVPDQPYNVLFLCTGNSARSILGEALMNKMGGGRFRAYSAGSQPKGEVHPMSLDVLESFGCPIWPGKPLTAHWGVEDPATVEGDGQRQAFVDALSYLKRRIELFLMLPLPSIDEMSVRSKLAAIGREEGASAKAKES